MMKLNRVLLVDDDDVTNFLNQLVMEEINFTGDIVIKENGQEALNFIQERCFDGHCLLQEECPELILLDINMPVMNGFEFLEALKKLHQEILIHSRVVMLSSSDNRQDVSIAEQFGVKGYVSKPLTEEKLHAVLMD